MIKWLWGRVNLKRCYYLLNKARLDTLASITNRNDGTEFGGSIYQKVNNKVETSVNLAWTAGSNNTRFGIAAKYQLDEKTSIVVRILLQEWVFQAPLNTENLWYEVVALNSYWESMVDGKLWLLLWFKFKLGPQRSYL